jgi:hypothetical protein
MCWLPIISGIKQYKVQLIKTPRNFAFDLFAVSQRDRPMSNHKYCDLTYHAAFDAGKSFRIAVFKSLLVVPVIKSDATNY